MEGDIFTENDEGIKEMQKMFCNCLRKKNIPLDL